MNNYYIKCMFYKYELNSGFINEKSWDFQLKSILDELGFSYQTCNWKWSSKACTTNIFKAV